MNSPFIVVIFGATGDLAQHKLIPALFSMYKKGEIGQDFFIVGFARRGLTKEEYVHFLGDELEAHKDPKWKDFAKNIYYQQGIFEESKGYLELIEKLNTFDNKIGACITRLFYLATPPDNYLSILENLKTSKLSEGCGPAFVRQMADSSEAKPALLGKWVRVAIEKPFGRDLDTARELDKKLAEIFEEEQIYRVDHYLGKETVQNMLAFRFANNIFEPLWNKQYIDHVQITYFQDEGIGNRGKWYDGVGILRDIAQNHLMQILAAVAMEQPKSFEKEAVRDARASVIKALRCPSPSEMHKSVMRAQYQGYRREKYVSPHSNTETFVAMKLFVDTDRFSEIPFYMRLGKRMEKEVIEISVVFIQTCHLLFKEYGCPEIGNVLTIRIQPDEGIRLRVIAKKLGAKLALDTADMKFTYHQQFGGGGLEAYEKILLDILAGDQMLFNRSDELESSWQLISNILNSWEKENKSAKFQIPRYKQGTWGPAEASELIEKDGRKWL